MAKTTLDALRTRSEVLRNMTQVNSITPNGNFGLYTDLIDTLKSLFSEIAWGGITGDITNQQDLQEILSGIRSSIVTPLVYDVTEMFDIPTTADVAVFMYNRTASGKPMIRVHGVDNSGNSNDLVITPMLGFGSYYNKLLAERITTDGVTFTDYAINIESEAGEIQGTITIPNGCKYFDISYFIGDALSASYWIDTNNAIHPFELDNTPIANFCTSEAYMIINGETVNKSQIKEIVFGYSYSDETFIGNNFLRDCTSLIKANLKTLENILTIGSNFMVDSMSLVSIDLTGFTSVSVIGGNFMYNKQNLSSIDLSVFTNLTSIGNYFLGNCSKLTELDLSSLVNLTSIGTYFLFSNLGLQKISIGDKDYSGVTVSSNALSGVSNLETNVIVAATQELGQTFKDKIGANISNWTIQVQS